MQAIETSLAPALLDELTRIELSVAQRADELMRLYRGDPAGCDFWHEAEKEVWTGREGTSQPAS